MVVEDVLDAEEFKGQRYEENIIWRIAALNHAEPATQEDPPGVQKFPNQREAVFVHIAERTVPFFGRRVPVNVNTVEKLVRRRAALGSRAQNGHLVTVGVQRPSLIPHPGIERNRNIFDDDEDFFLHDVGDSN